MLDFNVTLRYVLSCSFSSSASNCPAIFAPDLSLAPRAVSILPGGQALDVTLDPFQVFTFCQKLTNGPKILVLLYQPPQK